MKGSYGRFALLGALLCALLAAWFNMRFLQARERTVSVVTVTREVQPYTAIPADAVRLVAVPEEAVPADALTELATLQDHYSRALLIPGSVLRRAHLVPAAGSNLAARLAVEKAYDTRAMALQVSAATGVGGTLREGDPVDVLAAINGGGELDGVFAKVIAQRVPVVWVQSSGDGLSGGGQSTVVLQVTPEKAEEIAFAQVNGNIWLLTSPYEAEGEVVETTGVDLRTFLERYGAYELAQRVKQQGASPAAAGQPAGNPPAPKVSSSGGSR